MNNIKIGEFLVEGLQDVEAGNIITITLALDLNGILQVSALEKASGLEKSITIQNALSRFEYEALDTARHRINKLFGQRDDGSVVHTEPPKADKPEVVEARKLIAKAEALFDKTSNEDKEDMIDLIEDIHTCIAEGYSDRLKETAAKLADIIYYLES